MIQKKHKLIALIPARSGSKRLLSKNIKILNNHPLIAYSITAAIESGIFSRIVVSTEDPEFAQISKYYGADVPFLRPYEFASDSSPDIEWLKFTLEKLLIEDGGYDVYFILRPTSPFRSSKTIKRAWKKFNLNNDIHSLRAIEKCRQHPYKMWKIEGKIMKPLINNPDSDAIPWHSKQYHSLPEIYVQNASLEIAWSFLPLKHNTISGEKIMPFITDNYEGFDINDSHDWIVAEHLIRTGKAKLPDIKKHPYNNVIIKSNKC
jgi:CMP-N,N'-diacetyllegionaminic acid synthase